MSSTEMESEIRRLVTRAELLREAARGHVKLRRVRVKDYTVPEHKVRSHWRFIAPIRQRVVTRKLAA